MINNKSMFPLLFIDLFVITRVMSNIQLVSKERLYLNGIFRRKRVEKYEIIYGTQCSKIKKKTTGDFLCYTGCGIPIFANIKIFPQAIFL